MSSGGPVDAETRLRHHLDHVPVDAIVAYSRASGPYLRTALTGRRTVEAPTVAGLTVWNAVTADLAVVEHPNWWGRSESAPPGAIVLDHSLGDRRWDADVRTTRHIAGALNQLPGVRVLHTPVEAPWFVILTPVAPHRVVAALVADGLDATSISPCAVPELPGGLRIAPDRNAPESWAAMCVPSLARTIARTREE